MREWRVLIGVAVGSVGFFAASSIYGSVNTNITTAVFMPLGALMVLGLGIETWKCKGEVFGYVSLMATAGIAGAVLGLVLIVLILD